MAGLERLSSGCERKGLPTRTGERVGLGVEVVGVLSEGEKRYVVVRGIGREMALAIGGAANVELPECEREWVREYGERFRGRDWATVRSL